MTTVTDILASMDYGPAPEASGIVRTWLTSRGRFGHFIGGKFTEPGRTFVVKNPANGELLAEVTQGTDDDVAAAVKAHGGLDILVQNAGIFPWQLIEGTSAEDWDRVMAVNLGGVVVGQRVAVLLAPLQQHGVQRVRDFLRQRKHVRLAP